MRQKFNWTKPSTGKKYRDLCTVPQFIRLLERVIETDEDAEDFVEAYSAVSDNVEHNIGYIIGLISDKEVREDALELFMVDLQTEPRQLFNPEYRFSYRTTSAFQP